MNAYDFVHIAMLALGGEIKGKTKLQKTIYFMGIMSGSLRDLGYQPHFYGPFSADVADAVGRLKSVGFIHETSEATGFIDKSGFEQVRYDYRLSTLGRLIAQKKAKRRPGLWKKIKLAARQLKDAGDPDYLKLSIAAKTYFLLGEKKGAASYHKLAKLASKFGWSVKDTQVKEAAQFLKNIELVRIVK
ncbi:MAG: hypothetical protein KAT11_01645 [Phycisphaerae bacterium]|nr:hypothetical protein [Phycisphaerae bacterium]